MHGNNIISSPAKYSKCVLFALALLSGSHLWADFKDDVDFTKLKSEYGSSLPDGSGIKLLQVEYVRNGYWAPSSTAELTGKSFSFLSDTFGAASSHANEVGAFLGGSTTSMTPGIEGWKASEAWNYCYNMIHGGNYLPPEPTDWEIENHSWGGNEQTSATSILQKLDFRIERDSNLVVVGVDNGATLSNLLANAYNVLSVGTSTGNHPQTGSNLEVSGRVKPDLVGTATWTSYATPIVSSCAQILLAEAKRTTALNEARSPLVIKALLMAGATKAEFPSWQNSTTRPLDVVYGAGEVNIYNSYKALIAGRQASSTSSVVGKDGWDKNTTSTTTRRLYFINVPSGKLLSLSVVLNWYCHVVPNSFVYQGVSYWQDGTRNLTNLDLVLWNANSNYTLGTEITRSASTIDNVEHIYRQSLSAGMYALEVIAPAGGETYGLAWKGQLTDDTNAPVLPAYVAAQTAGDVGTVGLAGSTNYNSSDASLTVTGAGSDIAMLRDSGQFSSVAASGDFEIVSRISSFSAANSAAKAGVMIRESVADNSAEASIVYTPAGSVLFLRRTKNGLATTTTTATPVLLPLSLKLVRRGEVVSAYYSVDGVVWSAMGAAEMTMAQSVRAGLMVTSKDIAALASARFEVPSVNTSLPNNSFAASTLFDVGVSKIASTCSYNASSDVVTLSGTGVFPGTSREGIAFLGKKGTGDGAFSTRVLPSSGGQAAMRTGIMARDSLADNAQQVTLALAGTNLLVLEYRASSGGNVVTRFFADAGRYLLLDRRGNVFTAMVSADGSTWRTLGTATVYMRQQAFVGLVVVSKSQTVASTTDFESLDVAP